ncbi:MAG TPA: hypothetical protein VEA78_13445, partial [Acidimicrobiales bacterium]|nr:hypothetical protein [Acidimicrobiales bacterium]
MNETVRRGLGGTVAFAAVVALLLHVVTDPHLAQWISNLAYVGGSAGGAWLAFGGARRRRGTARHAWRAIGAGQLSWLVANAIWGVHESILGEHLPVPSVFDVFYGLAMLLVLVGVTLLVAPQLRAASPARTVLDVLLVAASGFYVAWVTLLRDLPELGWSAERAVTWLYPTFDVALACVAVIGLSRATRNDRVRWSMLAVGVLGMSAADGVWAYANLHGMFESGSTLDALWLAAYLVIGLAARTDIDDRPDAEHGAVSERWTALVPCVPVLLVIAGAALSHGPADSVRLVAGLAVFVLLCVRQVVAVLENQRLARDLECRVAVRTAELGQSEALLRA